MRIDARGGRVLAQPDQETLLSLAIAKRARRGQLRERDLLDDAQPVREQRDDLAVDGIDAVAQRSEIRGGHAATLY